MVRGRGFSLTDRLPPSGQAGLTRGASAEGTGRARQEKVEDRGGSARIYFLFFDSLKAFVGCHFVSADESGAQPSGCNNIRQAQFTVCIKGAVTLQECFSGGDGTI